MANEKKKCMYTEDHYTDEDRKVLCDGCEEECEYNQKQEPEVPERVYLQQNTTTDCYGELWPEWFEARAKDTDIEYVRTDAFIEKAAQWLTKHAMKYYLDGSKFLGTDEMVEDFKIAMKL